MSDEKKAGRGKLLIILAGLGFAVLATLVYFLITKERSMKKLQATATYETTAVDHLRKISACQQAYFEQIGEYATLDELVETPCSLLDERFKGEAPVIDGYIYRVHVNRRDGDRPPSYTVNADPREGSRTGELHFYVSSNVIGIRQAYDRPATAADRPRE